MHLPSASAFSQTKERTRCYLTSTCSLIQLVKFSKELFSVPHHILFNWMHKAWQEDKPGLCFNRIQSENVTPKRSRRRLLLSVVQLSLVWGR